MVGVMIVVAVAVAGPPPTFTGMPDMDAAAVLVSDGGGGIGVIGLPGAALIMSAAGRVPDESTRFNAALLLPSGPKAPAVPPPNPEKSDEFKKSMAPAAADPPLFSPSPLLLLNSIGLLCSRAPMPLAAPLLLLLLLVALRTGWAWSPM